MISSCLLRNEKLVMYNAFYLYLLTWSTQSPWFWHGFELHSLVSVSHRLPSNPKRWMRWSWIRKPHYILKTSGPMITKAPVNTILMELVAPVAYLIFELSALTVSPLRVCKSNNTLVPQTDWSEG